MADNLLEKDLERTSLKKASHFASDMLVVAGTMIGTAAGGPVGAAAGWIAGNVAGKVVETGANALFDAFTKNDDKPTTANPAKFGGMFADTAPTEMPVATNNTPIASTSKNSLN